MLHKIAEPASRFIAAKGNPSEFDFLSQSLRDMGYEVKGVEVPEAERDMMKYVSEAPFKVPGNVVAYLEGSDLSDEYVLFGAHYDSVNWEDTSGTAPGVDD